MRKTATFLLAVLMVLPAFSQESKPTGSDAKSTAAPLSTTELSEVQRLRLDNLRLRFYMANQERDRALNTLLEQAEKTRKENHMSENVSFDIDHLSFTEPPPPPTQPAPAKPEEKKK